VPNAPRGNSVSSEIVGLIGRVCVAQDWVRYKRHFDVFRHVVCLSCSRCPVSVIVTLQRDAVLLYKSDAVAGCHCLRCTVIVSS